MSTCLKHLIKASDTSFNWKINFVFNRLRNKKLKFRSNYSNGCLFKMEFQCFVFTASQYNDRFFAHKYRHLFCSYFIFGIKCSRKLVKCVWLIFGWLKHNFNPQLQIFFQNFPLRIYWICLETVGLLFFFLFQGFFSAKFLL